MRFSRHTAPIPRTVFLTSSTPYYAGRFLRPLMRGPGGAFHGVRPACRLGSSLTAEDGEHDDAAGFTFVADRPVDLRRFAPGISTTHGGFTT
jgi:hypothetical protein